MKPSELIRLALTDLEKCEQDDAFTINMRLWCYRGDTCNVCLAGAVMAQTLDCKPLRYVEIFPSDFDTVWRDRLQALDLFRVGRVMDALIYLGEDPVMGNRSMCRYEDDGEGFKSSMERLIGDLKEMGL